MNERDHDNENSGPVINDHPFFEDFAQAFRYKAVKELGPEDVSRLRDIYCKMYPQEFLEIEWPGRRTGTPRPKEAFPAEVLELTMKDVGIFLEHFFKRVEEGKLYSDFSIVIDHLGFEYVEKKLQEKTGLLLNLQRAYWTFSVKIWSWIQHNVEGYDCSLVCDLDEIVARAGSLLHGAFFPTRGFPSIRPKRRRKLQKQMLQLYAPKLEKQLMTEIYGQGAI